jgi:hypothetical protein
VEGDGFGLVSPNYIDIRPQFRGDGWTTAYREVVENAIDYLESILIASYVGERIDVSFTFGSSEGIAHASPSLTVKSSRGRMAIALANHISRFDFHDALYRFPAAEAPPEIKVTIQEDQFDDYSASEQESTIIHEMLHGLGFVDGRTEITETRFVISLKYPLGKRITSTRVEYRNTVFTSYIVTSNGKKYSDDPEGLYDGVDGTNDVALLWNGPLGVAAGAINLEIYAPQNAEPGSSLSHLADPGALMYPDANGATTLSELEKGILADIGWDVVSTPVDFAGSAGDMPSVAGDFNGDGIDDIAIGFPNINVAGVSGAGMLAVLMSSTSSGAGSIPIWWGQSGTNFKETRGIIETNDHFASALAVGDFNNDGRDDLAIGVPGEDIDDIVDAGAVNILYGSATGLTANDNFLIDQNEGLGFGDIRGNAEENDTFGSSLAVGDFNDDGFDDLVIGVPGEDIMNIGNAGAVNVILGSSAGLTTTDNFLIDQNEGLDFGDIRGIAEEDDLLGYSLATGDFDNDGFDDLAIGAPGEDIGNINSAGAVNIIRGSSIGLTPSGDFLVDQDGTAGFGDIRGIAENNDLFGSSLATGDFNKDGYDDLAIGAPGEDIENINGAGSVNIVYGRANGLELTGNVLIDQNEGLGFGDIRGVAETSDGFGTALATGDFDSDGYFDLAIGVPRENVGSRSNAGAVNIIYGRSTGLEPTRNVLIAQDDSAGFDGDISGVAEISDGFGSSLAIGDLNKDGFEDLIITVPGEDVGSSLDRGMINVLYSDAGGLSSVDNERWYWS